MLVRIEDRIFFFFCSRDCCRKGITDFRDIAE